MASLRHIANAMQRCSISSLTRQNLQTKLTNQSLTTNTTLSWHNLRTTTPSSSLLLQLRPQVRSFGMPSRHKKLRKARQRASRARGRPPRPPNPEKIAARIPLPPPPPVINAVPQAERRAAAAVVDAKAAEQLRQRMQAQTDVLRFDMAGVEMSDRVRKLFDLTNGSKREVVKAQKERAMKLFERRPGDTGHSSVQIIALTTRIQALQTHMQTHRKDYSSKRGLDALYVRRRKLLDYLERKDFDSYRHVVKTLGLIR